ncbi:hypothetical protein BGZ57DRAFT_864203, partial [Hyaloscypha finlandica]
MRLALPFSLIPLYLVQRSRVFCILLFCLVLRDSSLVLRPCACSGRNLAPRSIHRPSTFPLQRHVPPPPSSAYPFPSYCTRKRIPILSGY